jgi:hypothetical protein
VARSAAAAPKINKVVAVAAAQACDVEGTYNTAFGALSGTKAVDIVIILCKPKSRGEVLAVLKVRVHTVGASFSLASLMLQPPTVYPISN